MKGRALSSSSANGRRRPSKGVRDSIPGRRSRRHEVEASRAARRKSVIGDRGIIPVPHENRRRRNLQPTGSCQRIPASRRVDRISSCANAIPRCTRAS